MKNLDDQLFDQLLNKAKERGEVCLPTEDETIDTDDSSTSDGIDNGSDLEDSVQWDN